MAEKRDLEGKEEGGEGGEERGDWYRIEAEFSKTAAYLILLIKVSHAFISELWSVCVSVSVCMIRGCIHGGFARVHVHNSVSVMCMFVYRTSLSMLVCCHSGECVLMQIRNE